MFLAHKTIFGGGRIKTSLSLFITTRNATTVTINGKNSTALVLGGFGFRERQMSKHSTLYGQFGFDVVPVLSSVKELTTPNIGEKRGKDLAKQMQKMNQPLVIHSISGAFWTMIYTLEYMNEDWRDEYVKAIVFDSCPPMSDVHAFGGWMAFMLKRNYLKPYMAPLFYPYMYICGITEEWRKENEKKMFGETSVIPRNANILFLHGKHDPVLNNDYLDRFVSDIRNHHSQHASVTEKVFDRSRHAMSVIDYPEEYKEAHVNQLLAKVPEWCLTVLK